MSRKVYSENKCSITPNVRIGAGDSRAYTALAYFKIKYTHTMSNNITRVCVRVNANTIQAAKELLLRHGEEIDDAAFHLHEWEDCNFISKWRLDGKWRVSKSERKEVSLSKLVILLQ